MTALQPTHTEHHISRRVIDYAAQQFFAKGLRQVTMDDIAKGLQMSKRTLYQLFADKEQLIIECFTMYAEQERELTSLLKNLKHNVLEIVLTILEERLKRMKRISKQFFNDLSRYDSVVAYVKSVREESIDRAVTFLALGVEQGLFRSDVNFALIMHSMMEKSSSFILEDKFYETSLQEYFINIGLFHLRGCCTEEGIKLIDEFLNNYLTEQ